MSEAARPTIRLAAATDLGRWFALFDAVAGEGIWIGAERPIDREQRRLSFEQTVASEQADVLLAELRGRLVGALEVASRGGRADLSMFVAADCRGHGVGSALMVACMAWARDHRCHKVALQLWPHNEAALALYRKFGFEEEGRLRRHYRRRNGQVWDALCMGRIIDWDVPGCPSMSEAANLGRGIPASRPDGP